MRQLDKNESSGNREVGILVAADSDGASVRKNTVAGNYQSVDGGGNRASHNPDEDCSPSVSCS